MSDQNNQRQVDELVRFGIAAVDIFSDVASGRNMARPGWEDCWRLLRSDDLLVIQSVDRLGRDLIEVVHTVRVLHERGVNLKVMSMDIDTRILVGQFAFHVMAAFAQFEHELILERTRHGLEQARNRGRIGGARSKWTDEQVTAAIAAHGVNGAAREARAQQDAGDPTAKGHRRTTNSTRGQSRWHDTSVGATQKRPSQPKACK